MDILADTVKKAGASPDFKKKMNDLGMATRYMSVTDFEKYWTEMEDWTKPLIALAK